MRKFLCTVMALVWASATFAQTGLEILNRMNEMIDSHTGEGVSMFIDVKIPVIGNVSTRTIRVGDKTRMDLEVKGKKIITFLEDTIQWIYSPEDNEVVITNAATQVTSNPAADAGMDVGMFSDVAEGYDITIKSENLVKWVLACKKKKSNPDNDAPKNITIEVRKETYQPLSFSTKMMGMTMTMRDFTFGLSEDMVTFNPDKYPGIKIIDQREEKKE